MRRIQKPLTDEASSRNWAVRASGGPTWKHIKVQSAIMAASSLMGPLLYLQFPNLLGSAIVFTATGLAMGVVVWFDMQQHAWLVASEGIAMRARGREVWLTWDDVNAVRTDIGLVERWADTVKLKITDAAGKVHSIAGVDRELASNMLRHLEPNQGS